MCKHSASRRKGKEGEREVTAMCKRFGFNAKRRGFTQAGIKSDSDADVVGIPGFHIEVKRKEKFSPYGALRQAIEDSGDSGDKPVVFHRRNREKWIVVLHATDFLDQQARLNKLEEQLAAKAGRS